MADRVIKGEQNRAGETDRAQRSVENFMVRKHGKMPFRKKRPLYSAPKAEFANHQIANCALTSKRNESQFGR